MDETFEEPYITLSLDVEEGSWVCWASEESGSPGYEGYGPDPLSAAMMCLRHITQALLTLQSKNG